jgi:hypothetical protein
VLAGLRDLSGEGHRVVVDPNTVESLTGFAHPHDHRSAAVQIDTHDLRAVILC